MNQPQIPVQNLLKSLSLGTLSLGASRKEAQDNLVRMFTLKKNGMEYVGQLRISPEDPIVKIEVFNKNYFEDFEQPQSKVLENLTQKVLDKVKKESEVSDSIKAFIKSFNELQELESNQTEISEQILEEGDRDINSIFDRLNDEYFNGKIKATVKWGRDVKTKNKTGFRYGSYDENKKLIRVPVSYTHLTLPTKRIV